MDGIYPEWSIFVNTFSNKNTPEKSKFATAQERVRKDVECAFGILVHRWGCLRKAIPVNISIYKTAQLVRSLCMLHNFCIDKQEEFAQSASAGDELSGLSAGGFLQRNPTDRPDQLIDSGHHFDDVGRNQRREYERRGDLPREYLLCHLHSINVTKRPNLKCVILGLAS